jgi:hypothetical protein
MLLYMYLMHIDATGVQRRGQGQQKHRAPAPSTRHKPPAGLGGRCHRVYLGVYTLPLAGTQLQNNLYESHNHPCFVPACVHAAVEIINLITQTQSAAVFRPYSTQS